MDGNDLARRKMHRFIGDFTPTESHIMISDPSLVHQIKSVLKLGIGEKIVLCDGRGNEYLAAVRVLDETAVGADVLGSGRGEREPATETVLYCAIAKRDNFEFVVQKTTEIGVREIVPLISRRTVKLNIRPERLEKIAKEAAEQSERASLPKLCRPVAFKEALTMASGNDENWLCDAAGDPFKCGSGRPGRRRIGVFIGPEGGWDAEEITEARNNGCAVLSLGGLVLRAETAAIAAVYLACWH